MSSSKKFFAEIFQLKLFLCEGREEPLIDNRYFYFHLVIDSCTVSELRNPRPNPFPMIIYVHKADGRDDELIELESQGCKYFARRERP